jgi:phosphoribosylaminoimidazolecarboxamide formyltransferase/IMP cyclohydrolase
VLAAVRTGGLPQALRRELCRKAFRLTADYDARIADWFEEEAASAAPAAETSTAPFPARIGGFSRNTRLRYGENPHQRGFLYVEAEGGPGVALGQKLGGKELSYNNYLDLDAAYRAVYGLPVHACAVVKHTNPCGLAVAPSQAAAFAEALAGDPVSAFGSVLGFNERLDATTAEAILASRLFVECIIAPDFTEEAQKLFSSRSNLRLVTAPQGDPRPPLHFHRIGGGLLVEESDPGSGAPTDWRVVSQRGLEPGWLAELAFAMHAACTLKSNAIAVTKGQALLGAGAGHMSRVDAAAQALAKAGERARGGFLGSDAFFPFPDCVQLAAAAGIVAIVQPGGSVRDADSIAEADKQGLCLVFTGRRHFRH